MSLSKKGNDWLLVCLLEVSGVSLREIWSYGCDRPHRRCLSQWWSWVWLGGGRFTPLRLLQMMFSYGLDPRSLVQVVDVWMMVDPAPSSLPKYQGGLFLPWGGLPSSFPGRVNQWSDIFYCVFNLGCFDDCGTTDKTQLYSSPLLHTWGFRNTTGDFCLCLRVWKKKNYPKNPVGSPLSIDDFKGTWGRKEQERGSLPLK